MDPKITILVLLIGTVIGLSHRGDGHFARLRRQTARWRWREIVPGRRKS